MDEPGPGRTCTVCRPGATGQSSWPFHAPREPTSDPSTKTRAATPRLDHHLSAPPPAASTRMTERLSASVQGTSGAGDRSRSIRRWRSCENDCDRSSTALRGARLWSVGGNSRHIAPQSLSDTSNSTGTIRWPSLSEASSNWRIGSLALARNDGSPCSDRSHRRPTSTKIVAPAGTTGAGASSLIGAATSSMSGARRVHSRRRLRANAAASSARKLM